MFCLCIQRANINKYKATTYFHLSTSILSALTNPSINTTTEDIAFITVCQDTHPFKGSLE